MLILLGIDCNKLNSVSGETFDHDSCKQRHRLSKFVPAIHLLEASSIDPIIAICSNEFYYNRGESIVQVVAHHVLSSKLRYDENTTVAYVHKY